MEFLMPSDILRLVLRCLRVCDPALSPEVLGPLKLAHMISGLTLLFWNRVSELGEDHVPSQNMVLGGQR